VPLITRNLRSRQIRCVSELILGGVFAPVAEKVVKGGGEDASSGSRVWFADRRGNGKKKKGGGGVITSNSLDGIGKAHLGGWGKGHPGFSCYR